IHNFHQDAPYRIKLMVGEAVHILEENGEWLFGFSTKNRAVRGIFPKSYVHIKQCVVDRTGPVEVVTLKQPHVVQELTSVVREWGHIWKHLYIHSENFKTIEHRIYELIGYRSKILSGTLPVDELKEIKRLVTSKIDMGNKLLDLDMVVRDDQGNILDPDITSTIQLYWQHELATERIRKATSGPAKKVQKMVTQYSHIFFVSVRNFVCKMSEDAELLMTLYDAKEGRAVTENYVVRWSKEGLARDIDQLHNLRVLFTDLGSRDLNREKVYLVCYVVRVGAMEVRDPDHRRSSHVPKKVHAEGMRRPFGVAAMDVTLYINGKIEGNEEEHHFIPFLQCCERDNLDGTLRRIFTLKELTHKEHKGQGLWTSLKLLHGDLKQVREENPHLVLGNVTIARKMGFPEVILPGDVRNDLYLTLVCGEFSKGSKSTDKNVEVTVRVCNEKGQRIPGVITLGGGVELMSEYRSVIYYHEDKPRWLEIFKVAVPIEDFKGSHLKFTFKHRSSNETKDKTEKPFAMSYVKLMQENGTTLRDTQHELLVYKIDHKKFEDSDMGYLSLPSTRDELTEGQKPQHGGLSLSSKDSFTIHTNVCSTKLTQNVDLLGLLNWASHPEVLKDSLEALMKVDGEEIVKFLQDVLDALFNILMQNSDSDLYDNMVFECLLYIIELVSDRKYQHFQPVLDLYIRESFSATLAYNKLIVVLKYHIDNANSTDNSKDLLKAMKSLQYCMRFIVRSRQLFSELNEGKGQQQFELSLKQLLQSITGMMCYNTDSTLLAQGACLKYLPSTIPDILTVFSATELSGLLTELINKLPPNRLTKQKMMTVNDIVHSKLFLYSDCRAVLLPVITSHIKELLESRDEGRAGVEFRNKTKSVAKVAKVLGASKDKLHTHRGHSEEVELCVKILSDIMELLFRSDIGSTGPDVREIMLTVLRTVIQTTIAMDRESPLVDFYSEINRKEMYIRYVNKLCDLHLECDNYTEAAYTLKLHSKLLNWSDAPLPPLLKSHKYPTCQTHRELKEALYYDIIDYFDKGKMWECALAVCKELVTQYEEEVFDYMQLSCLLKKMSQFYDNIMKQIRPEPEYFRVAYYGRGFPAFLQNKVFVYRGKEYERLSDFSSRTLNQLPNAELMNKLTAPGEDIMESPHQYVQINKVDPLMDDRKQRLSGKPISDQILRYHRVNDVQKFRFSRPFHRKDPLRLSGGDGDNEFASLWLERTVLVTSYPLPGILRWFPVTSTDTYQVSPLRHAIETMEVTNKALRDLIIAHRNDPTLQLNPLSMKISGIVDAAVMGGVTNYEKAFFTPEYLEAHPEDAVLITKLQDLIASQIPLLDLCIQIHRQRAPPSLGPFQKRLEECFAEMQNHVESKYGKKLCDLKFENAHSVTMRRQFSGVNMHTDNNRLSEVSVTSSEGSRSRVSSLTRSQVASLKNFATTTFNFSNINSSNTQGRATVAHYGNSPSKQHSIGSPPVASRSQSVFSKSSGSPSLKGTSKRDKSNKESKRRSSRKSDRDSASSTQPPTPTSQWYTTAEQELSFPIITSLGTMPVFELRQELTPKRPLRSEVERGRRLSRPSSGQFQPSGRISTTAIPNARFNGSSTTPCSNRDSRTTDSTASEEDMLPPPLPQKTRDVDYCNLPDEADSVVSESVQSSTTPRVRNK
ncbi:hypothetical protein Cfor_10663, partial [Coptotermes formosanus]